MIIDNCAAAVFKHELLIEAYRDELSDVEDALMFPQPGDPLPNVLRARKAVLQGLILGHSSAVINLLKGRDAALRGIDIGIQRLGGSPPPA